MPARIAPPGEVWKPGQDFEVLEVLPAGYSTSSPAACSKLFRIWRQGEVYDLRAQPLSRRRQFSGVVCWSHGVSFPLAGTALHHVCVACASLFLMQSACTCISRFFYEWYFKQTSTPSCVSLLTVNMFCFYLSSRLASLRLPW